MGDNKKTLDIPKEQELHIFLTEENPEITIKLEQGKAEIEGIELPENIEKTFTSKNLIIYCWENSKVTLSGSKNDSYVSGRNKDTMREYIVAHYNITQLRFAALTSNQIGPRVLITGSNNTGKTAFCHMMLNYSLKLGWTPIYCDLDLDNEISIPGSIAATVIDHTVPNDFLIDNSIVLYNGSKKENINYYLYESQICEIADICKKKMNYDLVTWKKKMNLIKENDNNQNKENMTEENEIYNKNYYVNCEQPTIASSGIIIHCPFIDSSMKEKNIYNTIIKEFDVNLVYVIDNEKLSLDIANYCEKEQDKKISVILLSKLSGLEQNSNSKEIIDQNKITAYFKGPFQNFKINEIKVNLSTYKLLQVTSTSVTQSVLPIGQSSDLTLILKQYTIDDKNLLNKIVAIISLDEKSIDELDSNFDKNTRSYKYVDLFAKSPVSFFAIINKIDKKNNTITICGPCIQLVHKYLLVGDLTQQLYK